MHKIQHSNDHVEEVATHQDGVTELRVVFLSHVGGAAHALSVHIFDAQSVIRSLCKAKADAAADTLENFVRLLEIQAAGNDDAHKLEVTPETAAAIFQAKTPKAKSGGKPATGAAKKKTAPKKIGGPVALHVDKVKAQGLPLPPGVMPNDALKDA